MKLFKKDSLDRNADVSRLFEKYLRLAEEPEDAARRKNGLTEKQAKARLKADGKNRITEDERRTFLWFFLRGFLDQFVVILLVMAVINFFSGDRIGALLIVVLVVMSVVIKSRQEYSAWTFNQKLKKRVAGTATVIRGGKSVEIREEDVVVGDLVELNAGAVVPADLKLISAKDCFVNMSVFTGETVPVEKKAEFRRPAGITGFQNILLSGSSMSSGAAVGRVIATGRSTYLGHVFRTLGSKPKTDFEKGMDRISSVIIRFMIVITLVVFFVNLAIRGDLMEALLFAVSIAVGITPGMLPTIVNSNLSIGARKLSKKKMLVKNIKSIENLGAVDVLCTDKTGTLTENEIVLQKYIDPDGNDSAEVLNFAYMNSFYGTGVKNIIDRAVIAYGDAHHVKKEIRGYKKTDEVPFDYSRRMMSVVVSDGGRGGLMITKGALEKVLAVSKTAASGGKTVPLDGALKKRISDLARSLEEDGMQVIALAKRRVFDQPAEADLTFIGIVGFFDPPKKGVKKVVSDLAAAGVRTKILTGDNPYAAGAICEQTGLRCSFRLTGDHIDKLTDAELKEAVEKFDVFARLDPLQKERIIRVLRENGHVVGYMGDGVNDAPSLCEADVGISVSGASPIARESSDVVLLEKSLSVILDGVIEGRRTYGNIMKYVKMAVSANFGDAFSILFASVFLPFLPILPFQMLIQDLLYEMSQIAIPFDDVDEEFLRAPKKWSAGDLNGFMLLMGAVSSAVDVLAFGVFWFLLGFRADRASFFQTAWFLEGLVSQTMIIHYVRTSKVPFIQSRANWRLLLSTAATILLGAAVPVLLRGVPEFHFEILPPAFYLYTLLLLALYSILVEIVKRIYVKKFHRWL